ncbi:MAG: DUF2851 family protein [Chthoniobacterales bacterium]
MTAADGYAQLRERGRVHDRSLFITARTPNELELQARWFAGDFGRSFRAVSGEAIEIVQFGTWNREAGPDFHSAAIRVDGDEAIGGSIEFDLADRNWEAHGHAINAAFDETVLHVFVQMTEPTFFTRTSSHRNVLQVRVDPVALPDAFSSNVPLARPGRCQAPLKGLPEERVLSVIDAAARFRLQRKAARLRVMTETHGADEALSQETAAALGYKQNKLPFTLLAQRFPLAAIRSERDDAEAILFGLAGFLEAADLSVYQEETRSYVRELWDRWWPHRDRMQRLVLPRELWKLGGARPLNHPQRRIAALAAIARQWSRFNHSLGEADPAKSAREFLLGLRHPYWSYHYTLTSDAAAREMALIGDTRVAEILANVVYPFLAARGADVWSQYEKLPARLTNRRLETGATRLFGDDPRRPGFLKTVAHQQGLLQIYEDFCLQDNSDCAHCPFPEQMQKWA